MEKKSYESIFFEVEKDLTKPIKHMSYNKIEDIFSWTFKRIKDYKNHRKEGCEYIDEFLQGQYKDKLENAPMEILTYNFDTEKTEFSNYGKKSLIKGLMIAYENHYPITVSPDMILLLFLQGYSRFMEKYAEKYRNLYVNFNGKKELTVTREGVTPEKATKEIWQGIIEEFTTKIKKSVGEEIISNLESDFTTTNPVTLTTSQVTIMSSMKQYFMYKVIMCVCGISGIKLEGTLEDWQKIKKKFEFFSKKEFGLEWWMEYLMPIIDKIIETKIYYEKNKDINNELRQFWKDMIRIKKGWVYDPTVVDGWIVNFIPNLSDEYPKVFQKMKDNEIPDQIISCPLKLIFKDGNNNQIEYECALASGFYGMIQDEKTYCIKPVIGYSIVVEDKNKI